MKSQSKTNTENNRHKTLLVSLVCCFAVAAAILVRMRLSPYSGAGTSGPALLAMEDSTAEIPLDPPPIPTDNIAKVQSEKQRVDTLVISTAAGDTQRAADLALDMGDLWRAELIARTILDHEPQSGLARVTLAASLRMQIRTDEAMTIYKQLLLEDNRDTDAYLGLADTCFAANDRPQAFAWLARGVKDGAQTAKALTAIAHRYQDWKDFPQAEKTEQTSIQAAPNDVDSLLELASIHVESGKLDSAIQTLDTVLKKDPKSEFAYRLMGVVMMNSGYSHQDIKTARFMLEQAVGLGVKDAEIYRSVAVIYRQQHLYRLAAQAYDALLHLQPASPDARYGLGQVYALLGKPDQSRRQLDLYKVLVEREHRANGLKEELAHHPQSAKVHAASAKFLESIGDYSSSLSQFQTATGLAPNNSALRAELTRFYARLGWTVPSNYATK